MPQTATVLRFPSPSSPPETPDEPSFGDGGGVDHRIVITIEGLDELNAELEALNRSLDEIEPEPEQKSSGFWAFVLGAALGLSW